MCVVVRLVGHLRALFLVPSCGCVCLRACAFAFCWPCLFLMGLYMHPYFLFHVIRMLETFMHFYGCMRVYLYSLPCMNTVN